MLFELQPVKGNSPIGGYLEMPQMVAMKLLGPYSKIFCLMGDTMSAMKGEPVV